MKPPQRRRKVPARYVGETTGPTAWSPREMRHLLRLLQARRDQPEPDAAELAKELQGRSEAEICRFIQQLKGRVVREAIRKVHPGGTEGLRRQEAQLPAPIEVWMDLAEKLTGPLEGALTAAFSQVLTIAAAEPISLLHSKPGKPTKACGKPLLFLSTQGGQRNPGLEASGPAPMTAESTPEASVPVPKASDPNPDTSNLASEVTVSDTPTKSLTGPSTERDFTVDFEKIYKYLSFSFRNGHGPELSAAESAVVLDLLMSLPEELSHLPCTALAEHMMKTYAQLMAPQTSLPGEKSPKPGSDDRGAGSKGLEEPDQANLQASEPIQQKPAWQAVGICPLNPFLVPLELLGQVPTPSR
ncbi:snRNA-activating protein complex subunit 2 [Phodopus roborovskii]|uniref:Snapc2 protein n=1 Tax=Phodopus roborovskii TaxID=109678 RepID=A0AAV0A778_PHORO|nr:snRNA-activating protein complex subunit 2 [Phodopus roborovskii]CAH7284249.1 Snapc2 [Phodopus roborovskii]